MDLVGRLVGVRLVNITRQVEKPRMAVATVKARNRCHDLRLLADQDNGTDKKCERSCKDGQGDVLSSTTF
jgi:hypothetical protein